MKHLDLEIIILGNLNKEIVLFLKLGELISKKEIYINQDQNIILD